ncbi:hypothetical protein ABZT34_40300 [Streptomyces sp. NPDC005329]|uniref:hypothetical protein n=1 Tax=Streptomyces sp. NPDC005329 TaxID=3157034 RepID=UPI0033BD4DE4
MAHLLKRLPVEVLGRMRTDRVMQIALDKLLKRLADVPTPAGPTPIQIGAPATATLLPIIDLTRRSCRPGEPC